MYKPGIPSTSILVRMLRHLSRPALMSTTNVHASSSALSLLCDIYLQAHCYKLTLTLSLTNC